VDDGEEGALITSHCSTITTVVPWRAWAALVTITEGRFFSNSLNLD
jgi:hypothetical protein